MTEKPKKRCYGSDEFTRSIEGGIINLEVLEMVPGMNEVSFQLRSLVGHNLEKEADFAPELVPYLSTEVLENLLDKMKSREDFFRIQDELREELQAVIEGKEPPYGFAQDPEDVERPSQED